MTLFVTEVPSTAIRGETSTGFSRLDPLFGSYRNTGPQGMPRRPPPLVSSVPLDGTGLLGDRLIFRRGVSDSDCVCAKSGVWTVVVLRWAEMPPSVRDNNEKASMRPQPGLRPDSIEVPCGATGACGDASVRDRVIQPGIITVHQECACDIASRTDLEADEWCA